MSETAFTPGPWRLTTGSFDGVIYVSEATGQNTARIRIIARDIYGEANANLIAAAPALYEALKDALYFMRGDISGPSQRDGILREGEAAIKLARGQS